MQPQPPAQPVAPQPDQPDSQFAAAKVDEYKQMPQARDWRKRVRLRRLRWLCLLTLLVVSTLPYALMRCTAHSETGCWMRWSSMFADIFSAQLLLFLGIYALEAVEFTYDRDLLQWRAALDLWKLKESIWKMDEIVQRATMYP